MGFPVSVVVVNLMMEGIEERVLSNFHSSALVTAIFQCTMDAVLYRLPCALCYFDNVIITGPTEKEHLAILAEVLE